MNKIIIEHLQQIPQLLAIYIFGSIASGENIESSDIDIAFLAQDKLDNIARWDLSQKLSIVLQCDVDLVDLRRCSEVFRFQIISNGKLIYTKDEKKIQAFSDRCYFPHLLYYQKYK
jgi:predicted nucleotidyltransferase